MARSMLLISRQAPWAGPAAREALDLALAGGAFDLPAAWREFIERHQLDAVVCIAAALRRGLLDSQEAQRYGRPAATLASGYSLSGLGQLHEAAQQADRLVCFGGD